jgi:hypothetical protein
MMSHTPWANSAPVFGAGIYLSVSSRIAMNYAKFSGGWKRSMMGPTIRILALCEVLNHPALQPPSPFYVIPHPVYQSINPSHVASQRQLFPLSSSGSSNEIS